MAMWWRDYKQIGMSPKHREGLLYGQPDRTHFEKGQRGIMTVDWPQRKRLSGRYEQRVRSIQLALQRHGTALTVEQISAETGMSSFVVGRMIASSEHLQNMLQVLPTDPVTYSL